MIIFLISFFAFVLEFCFNSIFYNSIFVPLMIVSSLIILEPYFSNKKKYFIYCFVMGFIYDLFYTNTFFMNASLFLILGIIVKLINDNMTNNMLVSILEVFVLIVIYRFLSFLFYGINGLVVLDFNILFKAIYSSLIFNIIYCVLLYLLLCFVFKKFKIKRII